MGATRACFVDARRLANELIRALRTGDHTEEDDTEEDHRQVVATYAAAVLRLMRRLLADLGAPSAASSPPAVGPGASVAQPASAAAVALYAEAALHGTAALLECFAERLPLESRGTGGDIARAAAAAAAQVAASMEMLLAEVSPASMEMLLAEVSSPEPLPRPRAPAWGGVGCHEVEAAGGSRGGGGVPGAGGGPFEGLGGVGAAGPGAPLGREGAPHDAAGRWAPKGGCPDAAVVPAVAACAPAGRRRRRRGRRPVPLQP